MSKVDNHSELVATFTDYEGGGRPYDGRALRLRLSGDLLFVYCGKLKEERKGDIDHETFECVDDLSLAVDAETLYETLGAMLRRSDRLTVERARHGELPADDPAWTTTPTLGQLPAVRRRA